MLTHIQDFLLRLLFASQPAVMSMVLGIVYRTAQEPALELIL